MTRPLSKKLVFCSETLPMKQPHEIVHDVLHAYRGLPEKLDRMTPKSAELYKSHGREPKSRNPMASGTVSPVTHYMEFCEMYEAADPGAGLMLANRTHAELVERFCLQNGESQPDLECEIIDDTADVQKWLARFDIPTASRPDLLEFERECDEALDRIYAAKGEARTRIRQLELGRMRSI